MPTPSSEVITKAHGATDCDDLFVRRSGRTRTRNRCLSVVKLEEMDARTAAEAEAKARAEKEGRMVAVDKTLPAPPVPSSKPSGYGAIRRVSAQDIFHQIGLEEETMERAETEAGTEIYPRTPSLSAPSLRCPQQRHCRLTFPPYEEQMEEENGLDFLEQRLAEQVGTQKSSSGSAQRPGARVLGLLCPYPHHLLCLLPCLCQGSLSLGNKPTTLIWARL